MRHSMSCRRATAKRPRRGWSGRRAAGLLLALGLLLAACGGDDDGDGTEVDTGTPTTDEGAETTPPEEPAPEETEDAAGPAELQEITLLLPNPSAVLIFNVCAAIGEGYLEEEGLDVEVEAVDGSGAVLQALVAGQADIGLPGPGPVLNARARGEDVVMVYNHFAQSLFGIVVAEESDAQAPADLAGTTIGVGTAEGAEVSFARAILAEAGLEEDADYEFLPVGDGGPATAAFQRGEIAAYAAAITDMAIIEARGLPLRELTPESFLGFFGNGFAAMAETIDSDPEMIQGFANAIVRGTEFALANKDATLEHCSDINPEEGSEPDLAAALYDAVTSRSEPVGGGALGTFDGNAWEQWQESLLDSGELEEPQDVSAAFTNRFAEQASAG